MAVPQTDWPIYEDYERPWDEGEARRRWAEYNTKEDGEIDWNSYHKGFFWYDADDPDKVTSHKLPFVDVIDGRPYAIWRAIVAVRQRLGQTDIPADDKRKVLREVRKYYRKAGKEELLKESSSSVSFRILAADAAFLTDSGFSQIGLERRGDVYYLRIHGELGTSDYRRIAALASQIPDGASVVLDIDSPGGDVLGIDVAETALRNLSHRADTVAYTSGLMTSAAYLLGSTARRIYASETAIVGSVGVFSVVVSMHRALKKMGVDTVVVRSGELKHVGHPFDKISPSALEFVKSRVKHYADYILTRVKENRNLTDEQMEKIKDGASLVSADGKTVGLVDEVSPVAIVQKTSDNRLKAFLEAIGIEAALIQKALESDEELANLANLLRGFATAREMVDKTVDGQTDYEKFVLKQLGYEND